MAEPNGPVEGGFYRRLLAEMEAGLRAGTLDGVYCVMHGAALAEGDDDPEGTIQAMVRGIVGADVPVVATYDLHANVSDADIATIDGFVGYLTNPHMDMRARGEEAARLLRRLMGGVKTHIAKMRLPIVPPTVTMLTGKDAHNRPYGEVVDLGQQRMHEAPYAGRVLNVSVMGGFAFADTAFNGLTAVVTATDAEAAAMPWRASWPKRAGRGGRSSSPTLTSLADATALALAAGRDGRKPLIFADVADNPGGGGRGNTMFILEAFLKAGVTGALCGVIHDPALAEEAHHLGEGARFTARFNRTPAQEFSRPFAADATVRRLHPGQVVGRRGIFAGGVVAISAPPRRSTSAASRWSSSRAGCSAPTRSSSRPSGSTSAPPASSM
jgi:microcystin degradation protein MlrC